MGFLYLSKMDVPETDFGNISKPPRLGIFDFKIITAFLAEDMDSEELKLKIYHAISEV